MVKIKKYKVVIEGSGKEILSELSTGISSFVLVVSKDSGESPAKIAGNVLKHINRAVIAAIDIIEDERDEKESAAE